MTDENQDISGRTLFVLVILVLVVSFIGAWVSISQVAFVSAPTSDEGAGRAGAEARIEIVSPPQPTSATGMAVVNIQPPE